MGKANVLYELFLLTLVDEQVMLLGTAEANPCPAWYLEHCEGDHPNKTILELVTHMFDISLIDNRLIIHSTSWRYEQSAECFFLTYVVVLPSLVLDAESWQDCGLQATCLPHALACSGTALFPPQRIAREQVLGHALDHLSALWSSDPLIAQTLEPAWRSYLEQRLSRPAGSLQRCQPFPKEAALAFASGGFEGESSASV
jgi:hypothetical protein